MKYFRCIIFIAAAASARTIESNVEYAEDNLGSELANDNNLGLELANGNVDLEITLQTLKLDVNGTLASIDVVLSEVFRGQGVATQRSRYLGPLTETEKMKLPPQIRDGYKIYSSPRIFYRSKQAIATFNDTFILRNVPKTTKVTFRLWERFDSMANKWLADGSSQIPDISSEPEVKDITLGSLMSYVGDLKVKISVLGPPSVEDSRLATRRDGPIKWRRYYNKNIEYAVEGANEANFGGDKGYYVYSIDLHGIEKYFGGLRKPGRRNHPTIIKSQRDRSFTPGIRYQHSLLNDLTPGESGEIKDSRGFFDVFDWGREGKRFTYVIRDGFIRFSETGYKTELDNISKHFVLADGNQDVVFSGEMFVLPAERVPDSAKNDISNFKHLARRAVEDPRSRHLTNPPSLRPGNEPFPESTELPVLVIDNGSGTFGPSAFHLPKLQALILANFPDLRVLAIDQFDPRMRELKIAARVLAANPFKPEPPNPAEGKPPGSRENPQEQHFVLSTSPNVAPSLI